MVKVFLCVLFKLCLSDKLLLRCLMILVLWLIVSGVVCMVDFRTFSTSCVSFSSRVSEALWNLIYFWMS